MTDQSFERVTPKIANDGAGISDDQAAEAFFGLLNADATQETAPEAADDAEADAPEEQRATDEEPDTEETEEAETEEDGEPDEAKPQTVKVKVDGEEIEVTVDELRASYMRQRDYTQKTQSLAEERKVLQSAADTAKQERAVLQQSMKAATDYLAAHVMGGYTKESLQALRQRDQSAYLVAVEDIRQRQGVLQHFRQQAQALEQQTQQEAEQRYQDDLRRGAEALLERIPEWRDPSVASREKGEVLAEFHKYGWTDAEVAKITDPRAVQMARRLMQLETKLAKATTKPKTPVEPAPKTQPAKAAPPRGAAASKQQAAQRDRERLKKRGDIDSAAAAFRHIL